MSANLSNSGEASCGPGQASGWNWIVNAGFPTKSRPSTVLSLAFTCLTLNSASKILLPATEHAPGMGG